MNRWRKKKEQVKEEKMRMKMEKVDEKEMDK